MYNRKYKECKLLFVVGRVKSILGRVRLVGCNHPLSRSRDSYQGRSTKTNNWTHNFNRPKSKFNRCYLNKQVIKKQFNTKIHHLRLWGRNLKYYKPSWLKLINVLAIPKECSKSSKTSLEASIMLKLLPWDRNTVSFSIKWAIWRMMSL
jgi:hypothetical protein